MDDLANLPKVVARIRRVFDLDADLMTVESHLSKAGMGEHLNCGIRLPGIWSPFEAGIRAILGQQVSVSAARKLVQQLVDELGVPVSNNLANSRETSRLFPTPQQLVDSELEFLKMPQRRKETLKRLAAYCLEHGDQDPDDWLTLSGIGPWTVDYVKLRGFSDPNIFLHTDLGVKRAMQQLPDILTPEQVSPWGSYATFQLWSLL